MNGVPATSYSIYRSISQGEVDGGSHQYTKGVRRLHRRPVEAPFGAAWERR